MAAKQVLQEEHQAALRLLQSTTKHEVLDIAVLAAYRPPFREISHDQLAAVK